MCKQKERAERRRDRKDLGIRDTTRRRSGSRFEDGSGGDRKTGSSSEDGRSANWTWVFGLFICRFCGVFERRC
jgi:hypothetical protein